MTDFLSPAIQPQILEIYLYKNNYKDRLLVNELRKRTSVIHAPEDDNSFFVKADDVYSILNTKFSKDLELFRTSKNATSIYFINEYLLRFQSLKYFKVNVSDSVLFTREKDNEIHFDFRIAHSRLDLTSVLDGVGLFLFECIMREMTLFEYDSLQPKAYMEIYAADLLHALSVYLMKLEEGSEEFNLIHQIFAIIGPKLEKDNSILMVIIKK